MRSAGQLGGGFPNNTQWWGYGLLAVAVTAMAGWIWWRAGKPVSPPAQPPALPSARTADQPANIMGLTPVMRSNGILVRLPETGTGMRLPEPRTPIPAVPEQAPATYLARTATLSSLSWTQVWSAQIALVSRGISSGSLDGVLGSQTQAALRAFQRQENLPATGELDDVSRLRLSSPEPTLTNYLVTSDDLARLLPMGTTWLAKSQQERLDYETILELVAEKFQSHPNFIRQLNPDLDWNNVAAGTWVKVPRAEFPPVTQRAALARIFLSARALEVFDVEKNLLAHFPCSIARYVEKRPVGELHVAVMAPNPNYTFDPDVFPESAEGRELGRKLILPPGPNNPVGTVWIGLDKPGYGIHGTPNPEQVGRTESHGCFRLSNWNAEYLLKMVWLGLPVVVEP